MHMADALISPVVGGTLWLVSGGLIALCACKAGASPRDNLVPMMGVLGAFIFAAQMINFSIPGTGSSGHLGGGLILTILLGPYAALITISSVLTVQALFFADGGLLALGCNIINLGFFPAFVAYPLIYRPVAKGRYATTRAWVAAVLAAVAGLQLGAFSVVVETRVSGVSDLPFGTFLLVMLPIHLVIGVVEGLATASVVSFIARARPEALPASGTDGAPGDLRPVMAGLALAALFLGGVASWFASSRPDGLEWSMHRVSGKEELQAPAGGIHQTLAGLQEKTSVLAEYDFKAVEAKRAPPAHAEPAPPSWPAVRIGRSLSGIVGGLITLALIGLAGLAFKLRSMPDARGNG
ncbi:MAG: energy-coupling factor ABC transporter permease [Kiritimatiellia bacterium]